jgi:hypothetical protein
LHVHGRSNPGLQSASRVQGGGAPRSHGAGVPPEVALEHATASATATAPPAARAIHREAPIFLPPPEFTMRRRIPRNGEESRVAQKVASFDASQTTSKMVGGTTNTHPTTKPRSVP